jgi:TolB protein
MRADVSIHALVLIAASALVACGGDDITPPGENPPGVTMGAIAFAHTPQRATESLFDLYVARADGTNARLVSSLPGAELWPDLSPDGRRLVFTRKLDYLTYTIWIENVDGTGLRELPTQGQAAYARWSGDGKWIVFDRRSADGDGLALIRPDGTGLRWISLPSPHVAGIPASVSVTGRVAFIMRDGPQTGTLWSSNLDGSDLKQLTTDATDYDPRWSLDGTKLVVSTLAGDTATTSEDIVVMNADGSARRILTPPGFNSSPAWSLDGRWILYEHWSDEIPGAEHCSLYRVPSDGGTPERLDIPVLSTGTCGGISWLSAPLSNP